MLAIKQQLVFDITTSKITMTCGRNQGGDSTMKVGVECGANNGSFDLTEQDCRDLYDFLGRTCGFSEDED